MLPHTMLPHTMLPHTMLPHTMLPHTMLPHAMLLQTMLLQTMLPHTMLPQTTTPHRLPWECLEPAQRNLVVLGYGGDFLALGYNPAEKEVHKKVSRGGPGVLA